MTGKLKGKVYFVPCLECLSETVNDHRKMALLFTDVY